MFGITSSFALATGALRYYGADSGEGRLESHAPRSYQITVYDGAFTTPAHWREGIVYQIFPDRPAAGAAGKTSANARSTTQTSDGFYAFTTAERGRLLHGGAGCRGL